MKKREVKAALASYNYTMIPHSWDRGNKATQTVIFNAYDECGHCHAFFMNFAKKTATRQFLSIVGPHAPLNVSFMFWEGGDK